MTQLHVEHEREQVTGPVKQNPLASLRWGMVGESLYVLLNSRWGPSSEWWAGITVPGKWASSAGIQTTLGRMVISPRFWRYWTHKVARPVSRFRN